MGEYNRSNSLTIDPVLRYSSFLGGGLDESGIAVAVDSSRNTYYMGVTSSLDFPVLGGVKDTVQPEDIFVTKVSSNGKSLVYSTYLGGTGTDTISEIGGLAVDDSGSAYACGITSSSDFPTENPIELFNQGGTDAFIIKLSPAGDALEYSGYLGGARVDRARSIALGPGGIACVAGETNSPDFPTITALQGTMAGDTDAFVTCLNAAGDVFFFDLSRRNWLRRCLWSGCRRDGRCLRGWRDGLDRFSHGDSAASSECWGPRCVCRQAGW